MAYSACINDDRDRYTRHTKVSIYVYQNIHIIIHYINIALTNPSYFCAELAGVSAKTGPANEPSVRVVVNAVAITAERNGFGLSLSSLLLFIDKCDDGCCLHVGIVAKPETPCCLEARSSNTTDDIDILCFVAAIMKLYYCLLQ